MQIIVMAVACVELRFCCNLFNRVIRIVVGQKYLGLIGLFRGFVFGNLCFRGTRQFFDVLQHALSDLIAGLKVRHDRRAVREILAIVDEDII